MEHIKISAKSLGEVALDDFCPRCYWIKLHNKKLPFQIFPGIFSSIDAYTKRIAHNWIDRPEIQPEFIKELGVKGYQKVPHWSKFFRKFPDLNMTLSGGCDDIWTLEEGIHIPDYKTAKYTKNQDKLAPMYTIQLNAYGMIAHGQDMDIRGLSLIYMEPVTNDDAAHAGAKPEFFRMQFDPKFVPIEMDEMCIYSAMEKTREIYDSPIPEKTDGCKNCEAMTGILQSLIPAPKEAA